MPQLQALGAEHITLDIGRKSLLTLRHVRTLRALLRARARRHRACAFAPAGVDRRAGAARHAAPRAAALGHHRARPQLALALQRGDDPRRARDLRVADACATTCCGIIPTTDPRQAARDPARHRPGGVPARAACPIRDARAWAASLHPALGGDGPLLLLPGRGTRLKGHADALALLARAARRRPRCAPVAARRARSRPRGLHRRTRSARPRTLGIAEAIAFTAPTDAIARAYAASDLVLQLSRKPESFGRTVLEALSVGRPVLGWAHGGVGELLRTLAAATARWRRSTADALHRSALRTAYASAGATGYDSRYACARCRRPRLPSTPNSSMNQPPLTRAAPVRARTAGAGRRPGSWPTSRCGPRPAMPRACWCWARWRRSSAWCCRVSAAARSC